MADGATLDRTGASDGGVSFHTPPQEGRERERERENAIRKEELTPRKWWTERDCKKLCFRDAQMMKARGSLHND